MKVLCNRAVSTILLVASLVFASCQLEEPFAPQNKLQEEASMSSVATNLMERTVSNDGSHDNIVDGSSCFDIRFPYTVSVNGVEIIINSEDDLELIEAVFDAVEYDDDILDIIFPITITLADYTEVKINSLEELREIASKCIEGGDDDDIECIDVVYPVTFFTFDPNFQQTGTVEVNNDREMRRFFAGLSATDIISIQFPVMFEMYDGTKVTVNNNDELVDAIERAIEACDEDDDNDHNDDDFTKERLDSVLVACPWLVKELKRNNQDNTEQYEDFILEFNEDGSVTAKDRTGNVLNGEWETTVSDYRVKLSLSFEFIEDFTLDWFVYEIEDGRIKLFISDGEDKIIMKQNCEEPYCDDEFIVEALSNCKWELSSPTVDFIDLYSFDFSGMNIHVWNPNDEIQDEGNWSITDGVLTFNDLSNVFANYVGNWEVVSCSAERFKVEREDGEFLVFEKDCQ